LGKGQAVKLFDNERKMENEGKQPGRGSAGTVTMH